VRAMAEASNKESMWIVQIVIDGVDTNAQQTVESLTLLVCAVTAD
jgi:hypothetical protein